MKELPFKDKMPLFMRLEKIAEYSALTPKQQMQYDDSLNNYLAYMGQQEYKLQEGIKIGRAEGLAEGLAEGEKNVALAIARNLKNAGVDINLIAQNTGLSIDEINEL